VTRNDKKVCYVSVNKDSHVLEVPDDVAKKVPSSFNACAGKKGVKRFTSDELQDLSSRHNDTLLAIEAAQNSILSRITASSIGDKREMWLEVCCLATTGSLSLCALGDQHHIEQMREETFYLLPARCLSLLSYRQCLSLDLDSHAVPMP
jgi:MutS family domain IV